MLPVFYTLAQLGFQGVVATSKPQVAWKTGPRPLVARCSGCCGAKAMALAIAPSVIATIGTGIVLSARIVYGMASYRALPEFLANVSRRLATPVAASVFGAVIVARSTIFYLATSVQNAFGDVIDVTGLLFPIFNPDRAGHDGVYRRRVFSSVGTR